MSDDVIGTTTGTATYESVEIDVKENTTKAIVTGVYQDSTTTYKCDVSRVRIGGMELDYAFDVFKLKPSEDDFLLVEATEDELLISSIE